MQKTPALPENRLLAGLPSADRARLLKLTDEVTLDLGDAVYRAGGPIDHVYFPRTGIMSLVIDMKDGATVEVGTVGREGLVGLPLFHGSNRSPTRAYCQVPPCVCRRMRAAAFRQELRRGGSLHAAAERFAQAYLALVSQSLACNSLHPVEERLARWLLMTRDRMGEDELNLTQQVLSEMLGVRRASVTTAAGVLQKAGLIEYRRGKIRILDGAGLEAVSCECYGIVRDEFERLVGHP